MMKAFSFLLLFSSALVAAELSADCKYVNTTYILTDLKKLEQCFNSYTLDPIYKTAIIESLRNIGDLYPYVEIAKNPPINPPGYFKPVDYDAGLRQLEQELADSGNVVSKVFRPTQRFINSFRDGHFSLRADSTPSKEYPNIFQTVYWATPFVWDAVTVNGKRLIKVNKNKYSSYYFSSADQVFITNSSSKGIYVSKVDGRDAIDYFYKILGEYNPMKSVQGTFVYPRYMADGGFRLLSFPLDNAFQKHNMTFTNGRNISFSLAFYNTRNTKVSRDEYDLKKRLDFFVPPELEQMAFERVKNYKYVKRSTRATHYYVLCGMSSDKQMNYVAIDSFDPFFFIDDFLDELVECIQGFDKNDKPITIILNENGGGYAALRLVTQYLLMPSYDAHTNRAIRKTERSKQVLMDGYYRNFGPISDNCENFTNVTALEFWKEEIRDNFGNGVIHVRTKRMTETVTEIYSNFLPYTMKKQRKPTEIIVATDGFCFSACSVFVKNCITLGSAIITGYGTTTPGDELFVASQCPSSVISPTSYNRTLYNLTSPTGLSFRTTFTETYNVSRDMKEIIPGDYEVFRIDAHCGYNVTHNPDKASLVKATQKIYERFKTECNPKNRHLLLVTENCTSNDRHALYSGHPCGANGLWDTTKCRISACEAGYSVDFETDTCFRTGCDFRPHIYNSSSSSSSSSIPSGNESNLDSASKAVLSLLTINLFMLINLLH